MHSWCTDPHSNFQGIINDIQAIAFNIHKKQAFQLWARHSTTNMKCTILSVHQFVVVKCVLKTRLSNERRQQLRAGACRDMRLSMLSNTILGANSPHLSSIFLLCVLFKRQKQLEKHHPDVFQHTDLEPWLLAKELAKQWLETCKEQSQT